MDGGNKVDIITPVAGQPARKWPLLGNKWQDMLLGVAAPLVWGVVGATLVLLLLPSMVGLGNREGGAAAVKLATVDIAKIMQEFHERVLRDPNDPNAVSWALEESARAANQIDPLLKHLSTELHPGYTLVQPQALAYQGTVPDFTDEFRVLVLKRTGKFNKDLRQGAGDAAPPAPALPDALPAPLTLPPAAAPDALPAPLALPPTAAPDALTAAPVAPATTDAKDMGPADAKPVTAP